jgi:hypothetical protein
LHPTNANANTSAIITILFFMSSPAVQTRS